MVRFRRTVKRRFHNQSVGAMLLFLGMTVMGLRHYGLTDPKEFFAEMTESHQ